MKNKNKENKIVRTCFRRKIHIVDNLKTNMFIENDIINLKNINVSFDRRIAYIENYKIIVLMKIRLSETPIIKSVHLRKITIISSYSKISMKVHYLIVFDFRDFLFKFDEIDLLIVYAHLTNAFTKEILF